jgi:predicted naringenin-chalcone synthase
MNLKKPVLASIGTSVPPYVITQEQTDRLMTENFKNELSVRSFDVLHQVLRHPSVQRRYVSVTSETELVSLKNEDPDRRIARFTEWAVRLCCEALGSALDKAGMSIDSVSTLIVNTCTGYICPGIATYVLEQTGLRRSTPVYDLVGAGCGGAVPALQLAASIVRGDPEAIVACIAVEISSATFEMGNDIGLIVSNAIFGDGAAAAIVTGRDSGLALEATASAFYPESRDYVRFEYKSGRLHNKLDAQLPKVIRNTVPDFIRGLLAQKSLSVEDVKYWALHPGGDRILAAIQEELRLTNEDLMVTRDVLANFGNMSSPSVFFVLERLMHAGFSKDAWCMMTAYGAGMSIHGFLLRNN